MKNNNVNYVFQPIYGKRGKLLAVECLTRFPIGSEYAHISPDRFFQQASRSLSVKILMEQVSLIEKYKQWFVENQIIVTLNVDAQSLNALACRKFSERICSINCIHFELTESVTSLIKDKIHRKSSLNNYSFWLDDFGAGNAGFSMLYNNQFSFIKLDCFLLWDFMKKAGGEGLMRALLRFFHLNNHQVIVEGVETAEHKLWLNDMPYYALQGNLWKEYAIDELISLSI